MIERPLEQDRFTQNYWFVVEEYQLLEVAQFYPQVAEKYISLKEENHDDQEILDNLFQGLQMLHDHLYPTDNPWDLADEYIHDLALHLCYYNRDYIEDVMTKAWEKARITWPSQKPSEL